MNSTVRNFFSAVVLIFLAQPLLAQNLDDGLVVYYPFNGNAKDASPNCHDGQMEGTLFLDSDRFGVKESVCSFQGYDSYVIINKAADTLHEYAVALWFRTGTLHWGNNISLVSGILFTGNRSANRRLGKPTIYLEEDSTLRITGGYSNGGYREIIANGNYGDYKWHCVVANFVDSSDVMQLYVDGQLIGVDTGYVNPLYLVNAFDRNKMVTIGWRDANDQFYDGDIDDFRLYNRSLSSQEVDMLFHEGKCTHYEKNYTTQFSSSDQQFAKEGSQMYLAKADSFKLLGGCDSIINYYHKFTYNPKDCADSIVVVDTVKTSVTDTLFMPITSLGANSDQSNLLKVFPNATTRKLVIDNGNYNLMSQHRVKIVSEAGKDVFDREIDKQKFWIDQGKFESKGLYFLHLYNPNAELLEVKKIVLR